MKKINLLIEWIGLATVIQKNCLSCCSFNIIKKKTQRVQNIILKKTKINNFVKKMQRIKKKEKEKKRELT